MDILASWIAARPMAALLVLGCWLCGALCGGFLLGLHWAMERCRDQIELSD